MISKARNLRCRQNARKEREKKGIIKASQKLRRLVATEVKFSFMFINDGGDVNFFSHILNLRLIKDV